MGELFGGGSSSGSGGLGSLTSTLGALFGMGGGGVSGGTTPGSDISSLFGGAGTGDVFGMDPSGTVGASYALQPPTGDAASQDPGSEGGTPSAPQPPVAPQPPPQPPAQQAAYQQPAQSMSADPQSWQIGGAGRPIGPAGFVQQPMSAAEGRAIMQGTAGLPSWMRSGATADIPQGQGLETPSETVDRRFPPQTANENVERRFPTDVQEQQGRGYNASGTPPMVDPNQVVAERTGEMATPSAAEAEAAATPQDETADTMIRREPGDETPAEQARQRLADRLDQQQNAPPQAFRPPPFNPLSLLGLVQSLLGGRMPGMQPRGPWLPGYGPGQPYGMRLRPQDRAMAQQASEYYRRTGQMPPSTEPRGAGQQLGQRPGESFEDFQHRQQQSSPEYWGAIARGEKPPELGEPQDAPQGTGNPQAPSQLPNGSFPRGYQQVAPIVSRTLGAAGLPDRAVQGIMFNIRTESAFNPTSRVPDQPRWGGEAHYAHGLYQEGGAEWNNYRRWLKGRDWRDPQLQTQFVAENMKQNYPLLWSRLRNSQSKEEAARLFAKDYLKPANRHLMERFARINRGI